MVSSPPVTGIDLGSPDVIPDDEYPGTVDDGVLRPDVAEPERWEDGGGRPPCLDDRCDMMGILAS